MVDPLTIWKGLEILQLKMWGTRWPFCKKQFAARRCYNSRCAGPTGQFGGFGKVVAAKRSCKLRCGGSAGRCGGFGQKINSCFFEDQDPYFPTQTQTQAAHANAPEPYPQTKTSTPNPDPDPKPNTNPLILTLSLSPDPQAPRSFRPAG